MRWYAVIFWIWVIVSLGIFLWRRFASSSRGVTEEVDDSPSAALTKQWAPPPPDPEVPLDQPVERRAATDPTPAAEPAPGADRIPTSPPPVDADAPTAPPEPASLADLLEGISLPHGLVPLTQSVPSSGPITSLVAATESATAGDVGTALADELERLGYTVRTTGDQTAVAEGPKGAVEIEIHPRAATAVDAGAIRFPTAPSDAVVVELTVATPPGWAR